MMTFKLAIEPVDPLLNAKKHHCVGFSRTRRSGCRL
jgi:hypothetical protein